MFLHRLASTFLAVSLLGGLATAHPYRVDTDLVNADLTGEREFAKPVDESHVDVGRVVDRAAVRAALVARRAQNLALFRAYRKAGVFPHNFEQDGKLNVWLDAEGHLCAAATIISSSGNPDLAMTVPDTNNFLRLADVRDGELMDWILTSGFTQAELVLIQEPFMGRMEMPVDAPDPRRIAEDKRLQKRYAQVDRLLVKGAKKSLERAVDRLMANPDLARGLLAS